MTDRQRMWAARLIAAMSILGSATGLLTLGFYFDGTRLIDIGLIVAIATFGVVGAILVARVPGNRLGWAFAGIGVVMWFGGFQDAARPMIEQGARPSLVALGQAGADLAWSTGFFVILVLIPAWYPNGRALSPRWAWAPRIGAVAWALGSFLAVFDAEKRILWESPDTWVTLENPIGFSWVPDFESSTLGGIVFMATVVAGLIAVISLFARYRRSDHLARLQIRWLRASSLLFGFMILIGVVFGEALDAASQVGEGVYGVFFSIALLGIPVAAVIAITRNQLYELDRVISRTVTYGIVVGCLGALFVAGVVWLPQLVSAADSSFTVAASTLLVFVLFNPIRRRVQRVADARFNRLPYDPSAISTALDRGLRTATAPGEVSTALAAAAVGSVQPTTIAVWTKGGPNE